MKKKIIFLTFLIFLFLLSSKITFAQEFSLSLSPPLLEVMLQPGKSITQAYELKNQGDSLLYLKSFVSPFTPDSENGEIIYQDFSLLSPQPEFKLNNANISLNDTFVIQPNESQQLVLKVTAPEDLPETDYYYTFFISQSGKEELLQKTASSFKAQIGSHILLTVSQSGNLNLKGEIAEFKASPKIADYWSSLSFKIVAQNQGTALFKSMGQIEIFDSFGKKRKELLLRPDNILVNSQRELTCLNEACQFSSLLPGRFQAKLTLAPSGLEPVITKTIYFWIIPYKILGAIIISLIIYLTIFKDIKSKRKRG